MVWWVTRQRGQLRAVNTDPVSDMVWRRMTEETSTGSLNVLLGS